MAFECSHSAALPSSKNSISILEIAQHGSSGIARLLGQPDTSGPRIHQALAEEAAATAQQRERWSWRSLFPNLSISWQTATAAVFVVALMISAGWLLKPKLPMQQGSLLRSKALTEVESAESVMCMQSISSPPTPSLSSTTRPRR